MNFSFASAPTTPFITQVDGHLPGAQSGPTQYLSPATGLVAPLSASAALPGGPPMSCATDPLNDIGSPAALQYLLGLNNSPLLMPESAAQITSPAVAAAAAALGAQPKASHRQPLPPQQRQPLQYQRLPPPALIVTSSPAAAAALALSSVMAADQAASRAAAASKARSPAMDDQMPGMFRPSEVFTTPEIRALPEPVIDQRTPELPLFEDADALAAAMPLSALSPRTRTAQAGLTLLAASATYARDAAPLTPEMAMLQAATAGPLSPLMHVPHHYHHQMVVGSTMSPHLGDSQNTIPVGSPFLNAGGVDATLMSQPHNSLAQHLSPHMLDRGAPGILRRMPPTTGMFAAPAAAAAGLGAATMGMLSSGTQTPVPGMHTLGAGRLTRNRSLLRQSSGLTSASFHNDLVPPANESFFAPLDELCADQLDQNMQSGPPPTAATSLPAMPPSSASQMLNARHQPHSAATSGPLMGTQFSPVMSLPGNRPQLAPSRQPQQQSHQAWPPPHPQQQQQYHPQQYRQQLAGSASPLLPYARNAQQQPQQGPQPMDGQTESYRNSARLGAIFSHMPSLTPTHEAPAGNQRHRSVSGSMEVDMDDDTHSESLSDTNQSNDGHKRGRAGKALHKRDQQRRFNCDVCDRSFARQYNLKTHRLTHFPDMKESRPYKCAYCPKAFTRRHDLQRHAILHQRNGKHSCPGCGKGFPRKDSLRSHLKLECTVEPTADLEDEVSAC